MGTEISKESIIGYIEEELGKLGLAQSPSDRVWQWIEKNYCDIDFEWRLGRNFSPQAHPIVRQACDWYFELKEAESAANRRISDQIHDAEVVFDDELLYEVQAFATIQSDGTVEVKANVTGMGDRLPKVRGRKYIGGRGDMRWSFPRITPEIRRAVSDMVFDADGNRA